jgi:hypothetical protein
MATPSVKTKVSAKKRRMVRISDSSHEILVELAEQLGEPIGAILDRAIDEYQRHVFFEQFNAAYAAMRADPVAWEEELEERRLWETTLGDGLEDD